jgi:hypothetical protein
MRRGDGGRAAVPPSHPKVASRFGINPFSLGALVVAVLIYSEVFHLSDRQVALVSIPGSALGALGVVWAIRSSQRKWFAWTAFGLNFLVLFFFGFIDVFLYWLYKSGWLPIP